jgi:hypothetical protein
MPANASLLFATLPPALLVEDMVPGAKIGLIPESSNRWQHSENSAEHPDKTGPAAATH